MGGRVNGHRRWWKGDRRLAYESMLTSWRNPPPRTNFALWWPGEKRIVTL